MHEQWKPVVGYEGSYLVSNRGRVKGVTSKKILKQSNEHGYMFVTLRKDGRSKMKAVHRLVCMAFNGLPESKSMQVDHINMNRSDNRPENLEWVTEKENKRRASMCRGSYYGESIDGAEVYFPSALSLEEHGFDFCLVNKSIYNSMPYMGFMWYVKK